jgi:hypothetical protein
MLRKDKKFSLRPGVLSERSMFSSSVTKEFFPEQRYAA